MLQWHKQRKLIVLLQIFRVGTCLASWLPRKVFESWGIEKTFRVNLLFWFKQLIFSRTCSVKSMWHTMVQTKWSSRTNTPLTSLFIIYQISMEHIGENISICVKGCNLQSVGETVVTIWGLTQLSLWIWCTIWIKWNSDEILKHGGNLINYWWHLKLQKPTCYEVDRKRELVNYFWIVEQDWREPTHYKSRCPWISEVDEVFSSTEHWK